MKDFPLFCVFAVFYILIIILFQASAQSTTTSPPGEDPKNSPPSSSLASSLIDSMGVSDPVMRQYLSIAYGSLTGKGDCFRQALCYMGNYLRGTPGTAMLLTLASPYIPASLLMLYNLLQYAMRYQQDCSSYTCTSPPVQNNQKSLLQELL